MKPDDAAAHAPQGPSKPRKGRGEAMVFRRKRPDGTLFPGWYVRWTDARGTRKLAKGGRTRTAAEKLLRNRLNERDEIRATGKPPVRATTFEDFLPVLERHWRATVQPTTLAGRIGFIRKTAKHFGRKPLMHVLPADVQTWLDRIRADENLKASTIHTWKGALSSAFRLAEKLGYAHVNPVRGAKLPKADEKPIRRLTPEDLDRLYAAVPDDLRPCVVFVGETGLRRMETLDLTWSAVDDSRRVSVQRSKNHRTRVVTLTPRAQEALRTMAARTAGTPDPFSRVFPFSTARFNARFRAAADKVGLDDVTPHTLRHAVGTGLAEAGVATRDIRDVLGHTSIRITERYMNRAPQSAIDLAMQRLATSRGQQPVEEE